MTLPARETPRGRPQLRVVYGTSMPLARAGVADWRRVASAVLATTYELSTYLLDQRWVRVDEAIRERRELLAWFGRLPLDTEGRRCHMSLCQAAEESERAIAAMILASPGAGSA